MRHSAYSLVELVITMAVLGILTVGTMQATIGMRALAGDLSDKDALDERATATVRLLRRDLINSAWFYCAPGRDGERLYPQRHRFDSSIASRSGQPQPSPDPTPDTSTTILDEIPINGISTAITATVSANLATPLGDALVFVRLAPEGSAADDSPKKVFHTIVNFNDTTTAPVRMDAFAHAAPINSLVVNPATTDDSALASAVWETSKTIIESGLVAWGNSATIAGRRANSLYHDANVRLYCYRVEYNPSSRRGELKRYFSNPVASGRDTLSGIFPQEKLATDAWTYDLTLVEDVLAMRIETVETRPELLSDNHVRVALLLGRNVEIVNPRLPAVPVANQGFDSGATPDSTNGSFDLNDRTTGAPYNTRQVKGTTGRSLRLLQFSLAMRSITNTSND